MRRHAVPKSTDNRAEKRAVRLFVDLLGSFHETSLGGKRYVILYVDYFSRYNFIRFLRKNEDAMEGLRNFINDYNAP